MYVCVFMYTPTVNISVNTYYTCAYTFMKRIPARVVKECEHLVSPHASPENTVIISISHIGYIHIIQW